MENHLKCSHCAIQQPEQRFYINPVLGESTDICLFCWFNAQESSQCTKCKQTLPVAFFQHKKDRHSGIRYQCSPCRRNTPVYPSIYLKFATQGESVAKIKYAATFYVAKSRQQTSFKNSYEYLVFRVLRDVEKTQQYLKIFNALFASTFDSELFVE